MNQPSPHEKKLKAAYAAIIPFLLAEAIILVLVYTNFEVSKTFIAIVFGASVVLAALVFAVMASGRQRS